jgi:hypothetical protein
MWQAYAWGANYASTQQVIFNWMTTHYPAQASEFGVTTEVIGYAASYFVGGPMSAEIYGGPVEARRALADLSKNIYWGDPVISIVDHGFHAVIVVGVTWQPTATANPQADTIIVHDPLRQSRALWAVGQWLNGFGWACSSSGDICMRSVMRAGRRSFAQQELEEFDYLGGVYSGPPPPGATGRWKLGGDGSCNWDPNDSGPDQCSQGNPTGRWKLGGDGSCYWDANDSGPDQCSPPPAANSKASSALWLLARMLRPRGEHNRLTTRGFVQVSAAATPTTAARALRASETEASIQATDRARRHSSVPRAFATSRDGIMANFYAAVRQLRLDQVAGLENLTAVGTTWRVRDIIPVTGIDGGGNYYLLHLVDHNGSIVGAAAIDEEGFLMGYEDPKWGRPPRPVSLAAAETAARGWGLRSATRARRYVYAPGTLEPGASRFAPLARIETPDGDYYVNTAGAVFRPRAASAQDPPEGRSQQHVLAHRSGTRMVFEAR